MIALPLASFDPSLLRSSLEWQPKHHIHYSSRACDVDDDLPKVYNLPLAGLSAFVNYPPPPPSSTGKYMEGVRSNRGIRSEPTFHVFVTFYSNV